MFDPKNVLTKHGDAEWQADITLLDRILFKIGNNADDLHIPEGILEHVWGLQEQIETLKTGDGEVEDSC